MLGLSGGRDWYHSAQETRKREEYNAEATMSEESENDDALSFSQATLEEVPEDSPSPSEPPPKPIRKPALEAATNELYTHEMLALLSCFLFPMLGAYLLHTIRSQLSRPSEGLVSDYNLTIFLLASELRPLAHLVKLIQARTLHLQRIVSSSTYPPPSPSSSLELASLSRRLEDLETRTSSLSPNTSSLNQNNNNDTTKLTTQVRQTLQPELDALNRAVRRYEKRATLQAFQTDSRLQDLESRLNDAISLAAAAANTASYKRGFTGVVIEWAATAVVIPVQVLYWVVGLPGRVLSGVWGYGRGKVVGGGVGKDEGKERRKVNGNGTGNGRSNGKLKTGMGVGKKGYASAGA